MVGSGEHFALEIVGDSMVGVGILDGDTVVIQRAETARHGEIVVALIDQTRSRFKNSIERARTHWIRSSQSEIRNALFQHRSGGSARASSLDSFEIIEIIYKYKF